MKYPLIFPLSRLFAKLGATITITIDFIYDNEVGVFVATSNDIPGLVLEAESFIELKNEIKEAIPNLLNLDHTKTMPKTSADIIFKDHIAVT